MTKKTILIIILAVLVVGVGTVLLVRGSGREEEPAATLPPVEETVETEAQEPAEEPEPAEVTAEPETASGEPSGEEPTPTPEGELRKVVQGNKAKDDEVIVEDPDPGVDPGDDTVDNSDQPFFLMPVMELD